MRPMQPGLVSVVIAVYNRPALLVEAVESALAQTYRPIEVIVIDDGSTDQTRSVAESLAAQHPGVVVCGHQANRGYPSAWNAGLEIAAGEFVQLLDSDDLLAPEKLARQVAGLRANPECGISYCQIREYVLGEAWSGHPARRTAETHEVLFPAILSGKIWPNPAPLFRREVIETNGPFCEVSIQPDWEYECRAAARGVRLHHCREFLGDTRGTHRLEGRRRGGAGRDRIRDYAFVLERILGYARAARADSVAVDRFSRKLFSAARQCAAEGFELEARHCLALAIGAARPARARRLRWFASTADLAGWQRVGRLSVAIENSAAADAVRACRHRPPALYALWRYRTREARATITGQPFAKWPGLLWDRWTHRRSRVGVPV